MYPSLGAVSLFGGGSSESVLLGRESLLTFSPLSSYTYSDSELEAVRVHVCTAHIQYVHTELMYGMHKVCCAT